MTKSLHNSVIVVILAGGKARRFDGKDKGKIIIRGQRFIDIIHSRLAPQSDDIIISGTHDYGLGLNIFPDEMDAPDGPVGGLYSIWKAVSGRGLEGFYTVAVDGPNITHDLTARLYSQSCSNIAKDVLGRHPTYGWWRIVDLSNVFNEMNLSQSLSLNRLATLAGAKEVIWDGDESFININCPDDLNRFVKIAPP